MNLSSPSLVHSLPHRLTAAVSTTGPVVAANRLTRSSTCLHNASNISRMKDSSDSASTKTLDVARLSLLSAGKHQILSVQQCVAHLIMFLLITTCVKDKGVASDGQVNCMTQSDTKALNRRGMQGHLAQVKAE